MKTHTDGHNQDMMFFKDNNGSTVKSKQSDTSDSCLKMFLNELKTSYVVVKTMTYCLNSTVSQNYIILLFNGSVF